MKTSTSPPPHYLAFRISLVLLLLAALAATAFWIARTDVLGEILAFLGAAW